MPTSNNGAACDTAFDQDLGFARGGSNETVWTLLDACRTYLLQVASARLNPLLKSKANPSDLVQETLLEAYRDFAQFRGRKENEWLAWLRRLLVHNIANFERRYLGTAMRRSQREVSLEGRGVVHVMPSRGPTPSSTVMAVEQRESIERHIERLPEDYRLVLLWHHRDGLMFDEIGQRLSRSPDAARRLWSRAIDRLQESLNAREQSSI